MNKPAPQPIDAVAAARAILADRHKAFTISTLHLWAICQALVDATDNPQPIITTELAEALRALFDGTEFLVPAPDLIEAFKAAKTLFEAEFPNVPE